MRAVFLSFLVVFMLGFYCASATPVPASKTADEDVPVESPDNVETIKDDVVPYNHEAVPEEGLSILRILWIFFVPEGEDWQTPSTLPDSAPLEKNDIYDTEAISSDIK